MYHRIKILSEHSGSHYNYYLLQMGLFYVNTSFYFLLLSNSAEILKTLEVRINIYGYYPVLSMLYSTLAA